MTDKPHFGGKRVEGVHIDTEKREIVFKPGTHRTEAPITIPKGWTVRGASLQK